MEQENKNVEIEITPMEGVPLNKSNNAEAIEIPQSNTTENLLSKQDSINRTNGSELKKFEEDLLSGDITKICLTLRKHEKEHFWTRNANLERTMRHYFENRNIPLESFFSILIHNCFDQTGPTFKYFLHEKFLAYEKASGGTESIFERLFDIFGDVNLSHFHHICLMIISYYFDESEEHFDFHRRQNSEYPINNDAYMKNLVDKALVIDNDEYKAQIIKILLTFMRNTKDTEFEGLKARILKTFEFELVYPSICKISFKSITKYINSKFFHLAFCLKENNVTTFKIEFQKFMKIHRQMLGEAWKHIIKYDAQLLYHMAYHQNLVDTRETIEISTGIYELKHSIVSHYRDLAEFRVIFGNFLTKHEESLLSSLISFADENFISVIDDFEFYADMETFGEKIKNTKETKKLLFGRRDFESLSLFEKLILKNRSNVYSKSDNVYIFDYIWNEFKLWDVPEVLLMKNPLGKSFLDYVLDTENHIHLISFLLPKFSDSTKAVSKTCQFMMLKNALFYDCSNDSSALLDYHFKLIEENNGIDSYHVQNLFYLFEEMSAYNSEQKGKNEYISELFEKITTESEKFDGRNELKLPRKHFIIGIMMVYWIAEIKVFIITNNLDISKRNQNNENLFFKLLYLIIKGNADEFHKEFPIEMEKFQNSFEQAYELKPTHEVKSHQEDSENIFNFFEKYTTNFFFVLLYAAIKTNQPSIVEHIFTYENFLIAIPTFPTNMQLDEVHAMTALKFLENKYEIGRKDIPKSWITRDVLERFLNSRLSEFGNFYKIDCRFMLPFYNHDVNIKSCDEVTDDLIFNEDYDTMEYIVNDQELKSIVNHPVVETIIKAKFEKYGNIMLLNQLGFVFLYLVPTLYLVYLLHMRNTQDELHYTLIFIVNLIRLPFITLRECFQFTIMHYGNRRQYFRKRENLIEMILIFFPIILFVATVVHMFDPTPELFVMISFIEIFNIIAMTIALAYQFYSLTFLIYVQCFKRIFMIYLNVFVNFSPFFLGFIALGYVILRLKLAEELQISLLQYSILYSGMNIFDMDMQTYGFIEGVFVTVIFILLISKGNLILAIAVNDIQGVIQHSREESLVYIAKKYVEFSKSIRVFYAITESRNKRFYEKILLSFMRMTVRRYPYVQRIQSLLIDKRSRKVYADLDKPIFSSTNVNHLWAQAMRKDLKMNSKSMENCQNIIKKLEKSPDGVHNN